MPGERLARLNDIGMLTVSETLIDTHGPFDHGWSENLFKRIGHLRISLWKKICSRGPIPRAGSVVVVISGFGRSSGERGSRPRQGSIGRWAGGINGGRILGEQVKIDLANLFQN